MPKHSTPRRTTHLQLPRGPKPFLRWLTTQSGTVVGIRGCSVACPLARYLQQAGGRQVVVTEGAYVVVTDEDQIFHRPTPAWAAAFLRTVDTGTAGESVTAHAARALLEGITKPPRA